MANHHGTALPRGLEDVPHSEMVLGRFGRMFRTLPEFLPSESLINRLALQMREMPGPDDEASPGDDELSPGDNPEIPAGFTYVGQFLDHDLTFDPVSSLAHQNDPNALTDFRTPRLDLDSVYGAGPDDQPFLYDQADSAKLLIGQNPAQDANGNPLEARDLPRNQQGRALIGDKRNDENIIISQLQLTFLDFHNQVVDQIRGGELTEALNSDAQSDVFKEAQRLVRWHYQWAIAFDFLPRIAGHELVNELLKTERRRTRHGHGETIHRFDPHPAFYRVRDRPFMPVEFSVAAYRYGHSQIRPEYDLNDAVRDIPIFIEDPDSASIFAHLGGFRPLPAAWTIDWARFFEFPGEDGAELTRRIDTKLSLPMTRLPHHIAPDGSAGTTSLAFFNLLRGRRMGLPSGQSVARMMGADVLTQAEIGFAGPVPLWYYVLKEAEVQHSGLHLGQVGGRIVAEVILALIDRDRNSFLSQDPAFHPVLDRADPATFTIVDLIKLALLQREAVHA